MMGKEFNKLFTMFHFVTFVLLVKVAFCSNCGVEEFDHPVNPIKLKKDAMRHIVKLEILKTFPGVNDDTLLIDFLNNATYVQTLLAIQLQMCYFDLVQSHHSQYYRSKRDLFPKDFWVKDVHHGYYHYLKHLDPWRWWDEAYSWIEIKSSLPPLYYMAKYAPEEIRFLKAMNYTEEYYKYLTWPPGLDPLWTGDPNKTTNLFTLLTSSSSSESISWEPYDGESTTVEPESKKGFIKKLYEKYVANWFY